MLSKVQASFFISQVCLRFYIPSGGVQWVGSDTSGQPFLQRWVPQYYAHRAFGQDLFITSTQTSRPSSKHLPLMMQVAFWHSLVSFPSSLNNPAICKPKLIYTAWSSWTQSFNHPLNHSIICSWNGPSNLTSPYGPFIAWFIAQMLSMLPFTRGRHSMDRVFIHQRASFSEPFHW